jgi:hypothetical protein
MLEFLLKKAQENNKKVEVKMEQVLPEKSKYPSSINIIYTIEDSEPVSKTIFQEGNNENAK